MPSVAGDPTYEADSVPSSRDGGTAGDRIPWLWRICGVLAAGSSGAALLAQLYGVATMRSVMLAVALPSGVALLGVWLWSRRARRHALTGMLATGFVGGLFGTIAYDVARLPFNLAGQRIFAPIGVYGIWIANAQASTRFTEALGWTYHLTNGITFGVMYALLLPGRPWGWAVLWGLVLESIALLSPFAQLFSLAGNYPAIAIAYSGHIAYGVALGVTVHHWPETASYLARAPLSLKLATCAVLVSVLGWPLVDPGRIDRDARVIAGTFRVEGDRLNPDWLRIDAGQTVRVFNPGGDSVWVRIDATKLDVRIAAGATAVIPLATKGVNATGVSSMFVETDHRSRSSFVLVESAKVRP